MDTRLRDLLAEMVRRNAATMPVSSGVNVGQALLNPHVQPVGAANAVREDIRGPSVVNRILDVMSRPLYGVANVAKSGIRDLQAAASGDLSPQESLALGFRASPLGLTFSPTAWRGYSGQDKTTGNEVIDQAFGDVDNKIGGTGLGEALARTAGSFATDIALDPLTYLGGLGLGRSLGAKTARSVGALRQVEDTTGDAARQIVQDISRRAASESELRMVPQTPAAGAPAPAPGSPPRVFQAGPGSQVTLPVPTPRALPAGPPALDAGAISQIKLGVSRGVPLEQAVLRPLTTVERDIVQRGLDQGKSARAIERELTQITGKEPARPFAPPPPVRELNPDELARVTELEARREEILARIDDLEMQTSGTQSMETIAAETTRLERRLQEVAPELRRLRSEANKATDPDSKARLSASAEQLNNEREQILQRLSALGEENLESSTIGPSGQTRTIINSEINNLEREARSVGAEIERIRRSPAEPPTASVATPGDSIATPIPKTQPDTVREMINEVSGMGINWRRLSERVTKGVPEDVGRVNLIRSLEARRALTNSPVYKNMINVMIRKLREGVTPANLIDTARVTPPEFPKITLSSTRRTAAEELADSFLRANKFPEINHVGQTNLYNRIQNWMSKMRLNQKAKQSIGLQMLRVAEDKILASGRKLVDAEGYSVRLSDVAQLAGGSRVLNNKFVDDFRRAIPMQATETARASAARGVASEILDPPIQTARSISEAILSQGLPPTRTVQIGDEMATELSKIAQQAGASAKEAKTAKEFMRELFNPDRDQLYSDVMQEARELLRMSMTGNVDAHLINRINKRVYDTLQANPKILGRQIPQSRVVEAVMTRFATWWNAKDLRPFARESIDTARNVAAAFQKSMIPIVRATTPTQRTLAWRVAQGRGVPLSPQDTQLANQFRYYMERLVGAPDVDNAESVLVRGGVTLDELNKELPKRLQFKDTHGVDDLGREFDYRKGNWMYSWKEWDIEEPTEALYQVTRGLQLVTRKNAMLDDAYARWGVPVRGGEYSHTVDIPRLHGVYFPKPIAEQLQAVWNRLESDKFIFGGPALQTFDKIQRMWKTGVTIYSPSHHIRNLNGDIFLNMLDGVVTLAPYKKATQILHAHRARYRDIENVFQIMDPDIRDLAIKAHSGKTIVTTKAGHRLTNDQVYQAAESQGFLLRASTLEDLVGGEGMFGTFGTKFAPLGGRLHRAAADASELRDHWVRMAHFVDALSKSKQKSLRDAIEEAGRRVKKWHPDGSDLTGFEQSFLRRIFPFYSWVRKSTPLIIEGIVMRPHIALLYPKGMAALQEMTGIESQGPGDPFPMDQMFPDWIKEKGIGPILPPTHPLANIGRQATWRGDAPGYTIVNPSNPILDQLRELTNPRQSLISQLTPAARIPIELQTDQTSLGIPLEEVEGGVAGHLAQQIPAVGIGMRVTGQTRPDEPYHPEQLINWLTASGVTGTGPYRAQAGFEIRDLINEMARKNRDQ